MTSVVGGFFAVVLLLSDDPGEVGAFVGVADSPPSLCGEIAKSVGGGVVAGGVVANLKSVGLGVVAIVSLSFSFETVVGASVVVAGISSVGEDPSNASFGFFFFLFY